MKTFRSILIAISALSTLIIIGVLFWAWSVNNQVVTALKTRTFLAPTEYYSSLYKIKPGTHTKDQVLQALGTRQYSEKAWGRVLREGEYSVGDRDSCLSIVDEDLEFFDCLVFRIRQNSDPDSANLPQQVVFFDQAGLAKTAAVLESRMVAQFVAGQPIRQEYTELGEMPTNCLNAALAIEDVHFLDHSGVSFLGILRAFAVNILKGRVAQGGSTITQQMVKNYFLTPERSIKRKLKEMMMSLVLEAHASKDQILETYLNIIYMGQSGPFQIVGFPAAAKHYFSKPIQNLNLGECSLLAAVLNSPRRYDPFTQPENAKRRRQLVLEKMFANNFVTAEERDQSTHQELPQKSQFKYFATAPYYLDAVNKELQKDNIAFEAKRIFTGLDEQAQELAQRAVQSQLAELETSNAKIKSNAKKNISLEGVLLSADNESGLIDALVGGRGFRLTQFNRATDGHRQVGSIMKPLVYMAALDSSKDYTPTKLILDQKFSVSLPSGSWSPENYEKDYHGEVPLYYALSHSLNAATAALGLAVGLDRIIDVARAVGITSPLEKFPSLTLGSFELYPMEVLQAYHTFARFGEHVNVRTVRHVTDLSGNIEYSSRSNLHVALDPNLTAVLVGMLKQTFIGGTAQWMTRSGFVTPAAGKTGTTSDYKDSWFAGFTPRKTTVTWVGYDTPLPTGLTGSSGALRIWGEYMKNIMPSDPNIDFSWPDGVEKRDIDGAELIFLRD